MCLSGPRTHPELSDYPIYVKHLKIVILVAQGVALDDILLSVEYHNGLDCLEIKTIFIGKQNNDFLPKSSYDE